MEHGKKHVTIKQKPATGTPPDTPQHTSACSLQDYTECAGVKRMQEPSAHSRENVARAGALCTRQRECGPCCTLTHRPSRWLRDGQAPPHLLPPTGLSPPSQGPGLIPRATKALTSSKTNTSKQNRNDLGSCHFVLLRHSKRPAINNSQRVSSPPNNHRSLKNTSFPNFVTCRIN